MTDDLQPALLLDRALEQALVFGEEYGAAVAGEDSSDLVEYRGIQRAVGAMTADLLAEREIRSHPIHTAGRKRKSVRRTPSE